MDLYGFIWIYMDLYGFKWIYMDLYGFYEFEAIWVCPTEWWMLSYVDFVSEKRDFESWMKWGIVGYSSFLSSNKPTSTSTKLLVLIIRFCDLPLIGHHKLKTSWV